MGTSFEPPKKDTKPAAKKITSLPKSALEEKEEDEERCVLCPAAGSRASLPRVSCQSRQPQPHSGGPAARVR